MFGTGGSNNHAFSDDKSEVLLPKIILKPKSGEWQYLKLKDLYDASSPEISKLLYYYFWEWWNEKPLSD